MCDPLTIGIALASSLGSAYFENQAAGDRADAQLAAQRAFSSDLQEQRKPAKQAFDTSLEDASREKLEKSREQAIDERIAAAQPRFNQRTLLPGQGDSSDAVRSAIVGAQNKGIASSDEEGRLRASLDAFGDAELGRNIALLNNAQRIDQQADFARGAVPLLQADLNAAQFAGEKNAGIADAISALGTVASVAAPGFHTSGGDLLGATTSAGGATGATSIANNPSLGIFAGRTGADPFASGLSRLRFDPSRTSLSGL